jgi:hypothetical protein
MRTLATLVTGLGDAVLLLPAALVLLIYLARSRNWRAASAWMAALTLCVALTVVTKIVFHACGAAFPDLAIRSPSGHTSLSATFYGCSALMVASEQSRTQRLAVLFAGGGLIMAIAASRIALHAHTVQEVAGGLAIGLLCIAVYAIGCLPRVVSLPGWRAPVAALVILAVLTHGRHLNVESLLDRMADRLRLAGYICPLPEDIAARSRHHPSNPLAPSSNADSPSSGSRRVAAWR